MAGKKKEKAMSSTAVSTRTVSEAMSDTLSLAMKDKDSELEKTTAADAARLKEVLKEKMCGGSSGDTSMPP